MKWHHRIPPDKKALVLSILISAIVWVSLQLSKTRILEREIETDFMPYPGYSLATPQSQKLTLRISGSSWKLLALTIKNGTKWTYALPERTELILSERILSDLIRKSFDTKGIQIESVTPSPLVIHQIKENSKTIPIALKVKALLPKNYLLNGPVEMRPDSVQVFGPPDKLRAYDHLDMGTQTIANIEGNTLHQRIALPVSPPDIRFLFDSVDLVIPIEEATEKRLMVPILYDNSYPIAKIFPDKAQITLRTPLSRYESITADKIRLTFTPDTIHRYPTYPLQLARIPPYAKHISTLPSYVEVYFR